MTGKSPLKARPLRNPGDSLDREISALVDDTASLYFVIALMLTTLAVLEWYGYLTHAPRQPLLYSAMATLAVALFLFKFFTIRRRVRQLRLGRDGERCVGQFLERLREHDAQIFHDVPGEGFNLDHVVVSTRGVFAIETKTFSKPFADARVVVSGDRLTVAGRAPDRDPIAQVTAGARWLEKELEKSSGRRAVVRPVVAFPGWYVEQTEPRGEVWVVEPKMIPALIAKEPLVFRPEDAKLMAYHLSRYIRSEVDKV